MKQFIFLCCLVVASSFSYGQRFPAGSWSIVTDSKGNFMDPKSTITGARQVTSFDFKEGGKYSFQYQEYDSLGRKISEVSEYGLYTVSASEFVLNPSASTTTFYEYMAQASRAVSSVSKQNPASPAQYSWSYQREGDAKLVIEALNPGYREGFLSTTKTRSQASRTTKRSTPLSAVRPQVRSL